MKIELRIGELDQILRKSHRQPFIVIISDHMFSNKSPATFLLAIVLLQLLVFNYYPPNCLMPILFQSLSF